jgi:hypothetical protein
LHLAAQIHHCPQYWSGIAIAHRQPTTNHPHLPRGVRGSTVFVRPKCPRAVVHRLHWSTSTLCNKIIVRSLAVENYLRYPSNGLPQLAAPVVSDAPVISSTPTHASNNYGQKDEYL